MIILTILLTILIFSCVFFLKSIFIKKVQILQSQEIQFLQLQASCRKLKVENENFKKIFEDTQALYDITRQICAYLNEDEVFARFCQEITKYVEIKSCQLIKDEAQVPFGNEGVLLRFEINNSFYGYLAADLIKPDDKEKFNILTHQLLLGLKRARLYQRVQELAITDSLTKVFARRYCLERLEEEIQRARKAGAKFAVLMVDIDRFKEYNDRFGHLVGDAILKHTAKMIKESLRQVDLVGRYGGEEFLVILTETDTEQAMLAAERIRIDIEKEQFNIYDELLNITISIGISSFPENSDDSAVLIDKADLALYRAKEAGRNKTFRSS